MASKTYKLKAVLYAVSLATSGSVLAYDAFTESGAIPTEVHSWQSTLPPIGDSNCSFLCGFLNGVGEMNVIMRVQNTTAGFTGGVPNAFIDTYAGTQVVPSSGALPIFLYYDFYSPVFVDNYLYTYNPAIADDVQMFVPFDWNFTTSKEGKIIEGYVTVLEFTGDVDSTTFDFTTRKIFVVSGCALDASGNPIAPTITALRDIDPTDLSGTMPATGCNIFELKAPLAYLTCDTNDECGQFGKSVSVPVFAVYVLVLGLLGVTLRQRKKSKAN